MKKKYPILYDTTRIKFNKNIDSKDILKLFKQIFDRTFQKDILEWYDACPHGSNIWYGAFHDGIPVGMYALLPMQFCIDNQIYNGALCNNVGIIPEFQGKGLFQALGEYALQDSNFPIVVGVPNAKAVKGHKRIGWKSHGTLELLHGEISSREILESQVLDKELVFTDKKNSYRFYVKKDLDWMRWRYSKPGYQYQQNIFADDKQIIWKYYDQKKQVLETDDIDLIFKLDGQVDIWQFSGSAQSGYLKSKGFIPILKNELIFYLNQEIDLSFDVNSINFELGDNDVF